MIWSGCPGKPYSHARSFIDSSFANLAVRRPRAGPTNLTWKSNETVPSHPAKARLNTSPARFGTIRLFDALEPARRFILSATFEPGARTAWHTHPLGQTLIVTAGCGWAQRWDGQKEETRPGDVVWFSPGEKHWHGATSTTTMTFIATVEKLEGKVVEWMQKVTEEQYQNS
jgi:quercetin dioxygenase-like cupin family protein